MEAVELSRAEAQEAIKVLHDLSARQLRAGRTDMNGAQLRSFLQQADMALDEVSNVSGCKRDLGETSVLT
jgi:hypothetical protein